MRTVRVLEEKAMKKILISSLLLFAFCIPGLSQYKFTKLFTPPNYGNLMPHHINNLGKIVATITKIDMRTVLSAVVGLSTPVLTFQVPPKRMCLERTVT